MPAPRTDSVLNYLADDPHQNAPTFTGKIVAALAFIVDNWGIDGKKKITKWRAGSETAIPCENYVSNKVLLSSNMPIRPKEITWDMTYRMLVDKARTEVTRYLGD